MQSPIFLSEDIEYILHAACLSYSGDSILAESQVALPAVTLNEVIYSSFTKYIRLDDVLRAPTLQVSP